MRALRGDQRARAAGTATPAHLRANRPAAHPALPGSRILSQLRALAREFPVIGEIRGPRENVVRLLPPLTDSEEQAAAVPDRPADAPHTVSVPGRRVVAL